MITDKKIITSVLLSKDLISKNNIEFRPLKGGVSSDIYMITDGYNRYVVKKALPRLKVRDKWFADTSRNLTEYKFILYLKSILPEAVPNVLYYDADHQFFVMEYLDNSFQNWKQKLLSGNWLKMDAKKAAQVISAIHSISGNDENLKNDFDTTEAFRSLRIEPYLITTGDRHPDFKNEFYIEAERLLQTREVLIHGDYSPKNIMISPERFVLLDHEVAWYGDPAFDIAFLLNHLYLKMLYQRNRILRLPDLSIVFWNEYLENTETEPDLEFEKRVGKLLLMLMLARVDGKSPVEYLKDRDKKFIRSFAYENLTCKIYNQLAINQKWKSKLKNYTFENQTN